MWDKIPRVLRHGITRRDREREREKETDGHTHIEERNIM